MPELKRYGLFISHAWEYGEEYNRIVKMLKEAPYFSFKDFSCPRENPAVDPRKHYPIAKLTEELKYQICPVNCVIILSGMYVAYSDWIQREIDIALSMGKPIVGVYPWGHERLPHAVSDVADEVVRWNTSSIVGAIRRNSR